MINEYIARRKVNNTLYLMEKTNTFKDNIKLHDETRKFVEKALDIIYSYID